MDELIASMVNRENDRSRRIAESAQQLVSKTRTVESGSQNEHYGEMTLEPIDVAKEWLSDEQLEGAYLFQIIKYLGRYRMKVQGKGGKTDLLKMRDYLNLLIDMQVDILPALKDGDS